jgi:hypothetical protein
VVIEVTVLGGEDRMAYGDGYVGEGYVTVVGDADPGEDRVRVPVVEDGRFGLGRDGGDGDGFDVGLGGAGAGCGPEERENQRLAQDAAPPTATPCRRRCQALGSDVTGAAVPELGVRGAGVRGAGVRGTRFRGTALAESGVFGLKVFGMGLAQSGVFGLEVFGIAGTGLTEDGGLVRG